MLYYADFFSYIAAALVQLECEIHMGEIDIK